MAKRSDKSQIDLEDVIAASQDHAAAAEVPPVSVPSVFIRTQFDGYADPASEYLSIIFPPPTEEEFSALQSFKDESDINLIVKRMESGQFDEFYERVGSGYYLDLTAVPDYTDARQKVALANSAFEQIPADIRKKFDNDPAKFLAFIDKGDRKEFEELGLVLPELPQPPAESIVSDPAAPTPSDSK